MTSVCLRRLQELSAKVYKVGVPSLTESDEGAGTWRTDVRAQCHRAMTSVCLRRVQELSTNKRRLDLTSPKATNEPEPGEPMSDVAWITAEAEHATRLPCRNPLRWTGCALAQAALRRGAVTMGWLEALVLGIVQGLTEFIPISSSAHQSIVGQLFGGHDPGSAFTAITQLGTESAVIIYFRKDIWLIMKSWVLALTGKLPRGDAEARLGWLVIIGSIPIVVLGLVFQDAIDHGLRNLWITAAMLAGFGIIIGVIDRVAANARPLESMTWRHGLFLGLVQSLALIPGVSRSGATIAGGLALGYERVAAAKYSFLLAIPAVVGSGFFKLADISSDPVPPAWGPIALATVVSFAIGYAVIAWLLRYVSTHTFLPFVIYRIALAAVVVVLLLTGVLSPLPPSSVGQPG